jgi:hypothetical protein
MIKPALVGMEVRVRSHVPLADDGAFVANLAQNLCNGLLFKRQAGLGIAGVNGRVSGETEAILIASGEQPGATGTTDWEGDVAVGEFHPVGSEAVEVRSGDIGAAVKANIVVALVVRENNYQIWAVRSTQRGKREACNEAKEASV